jgi:hypothetical protein
MGTGHSPRPRSEPVSRLRAAEQLVDIAYALTVGGPLDLGTEGAEAGVPVPEEVRLESETRTDGDRVEIAVLVSWPV